MASDQSINIFEQIESICREFRSQWKRGERPKIAAFLTRVDDNAQINLFRNLLTTEVKLRFRNGESPAASDYLDRFPQFATVIRQEFDESTSMSFELNRATPDQANADDDDATRTISLNEPAASRLGDYELLEEIGRGGFGVVYEARHLKQQNHVALKTLPTGANGQEINAERLHKFRREFRTLSEINHPNLVGMQSLEFDGTQWFFTMDLIKGNDFLSYVRPNEQLDEARLRQSLKQLAGGIIALHEKGIVHRDLKPSNVLVESDGRVVILDFGLVAELQKSGDMTQTRSGMFAGTPRYAAPEQMFGDRSEASDWYAMGVMMYEALTGEPPFKGANPMEVLRKKQNEDPPSVSQIAHLPEDLTTLADALLKRDPTFRPGSNQIAESLQLDVESTKHPSSATADDDAIDLNAISDDDIELIGRDHQLNQLNEIKTNLLNDHRPVVTWVSGLSGEGKSALVGKFIAPIRRGTEMLVLSGRCYDRESVPFKVIDSQIDSLVRYLRSLSTEQVAQILPTDIESLAKLFPVLNRVPSIERRTSRRISGYSDQQVRNLGFAALKDLLFNIGQDAPLVMFVDDLQWGDSDSAEVLVELLSPPNPPPLMLIGSFRSDEADESPFLCEWKQQTEKLKSATFSEQQIAVEPLTETDCLTFIKKRLGRSLENIDAAVSQLYINSKGNPYFLEQLIEGINPETGEFNPIPLEQVIQNRLKRCPPGATELLEVIAVSGKATALMDIAEVAGQSAIAIATMNHMRSERLLRLIGSQANQQIDTYHDKIRETIVDRIPQAQKTTLHLSFAQTLQRHFEAETSDPDSAHREGSSNRTFDIAHHLYEANDARASDFLLKAGEISVNAYANDIALEYLEKAKSIMPPNVDIETKYRLAFLLGKSFAGCDRIEEAIVEFKKALSISDKRLEKATCYFEIGVALWTQDKYQEGMAQITLGMREFGERYPKMIVTKLLAGLIGAIQFHFIPNWLRFRLSRLTQEEVSFLSQMYARLHIMVTREDFYAYTYVALRACVVAKHSKNENNRAIAYSSYAFMRAMTVASWSASSLLKKVERFTKDGERELSGLLDFNLGIVRYCQGDFEQATQLLLRSAEQMMRAGSHQRAVSFHMLWHLYSATGDSREIFKYAQSEFETAVSMKHKSYIAYSKYGRAEALAKQGKLVEAKALADAALEILVPENDGFICIGRLQKAKVLIQAGDYADARETLWLAIKDIPKLRTMDISVPAFAAMVESILAGEWVNTKNRIRWKDKRKAGFFAFIARMFGFNFPNTKPGALRITGRLAAAKGKKRKAIKYFDKAIKFAEKRGVRYELARALIDKSMLDQPDAQQNRKRGLDILKEIHCVLPIAEQKYLGIEMPPIETDSEFPTETN